MSDDTRPLRVAIVHDWLVGGGAELVVEQLHNMFPEAPIYTSYATREWRNRLDGKVVTGWLQLLGGVRKFIPVLRIWWFTRLKFKDYDLVISSSGAEAKGIKVPESTIHINYCHAPTHYYWSRYDEYMRRPGFGIFNWPARLGLKLLVGPLRRWDRKAAQRPDYILANSSYTKAEIKKYYNRQSTVVHPPVYVERFQKVESKSKARRGFVITGRQTAYKRFDIAVEACTKLDLPLTVIGDGPEHGRLRKMAGSNITFLGKVSDEVLEKELSAAGAFIFPGTDDFGISAVEALAAGTPVIAYKAGGALDYVVPGKSGEFFDKPAPGSLRLVLSYFKPEQYNADKIARYADKFSTTQFIQNMELIIKKALLKA